MKRPLKVFLLLFLWPAIAFPAYVIPMGLEQLASESDSIIVGRLISKYSYWKNNKIYTDHTIIPSDVLKGAMQSQYNVTTLGGQAAHPRLNTPVLMSVPGAASLKNGSEYVLFIAKNSSGIDQITGMSQGAFFVHVDEKIGEKVVAVGQKKLIRSEGEAVVSGQLFSLEVSDFSLDAIQMSLGEFKDEILIYLGEEQ